jgi:hypothetical protein
MMGHLNATTHHGESMIRPAFLPFALLSACIFGGCSAQVLAIEVLPSRSGVSCAAPNVNSAAAGRGLLDLNAVDNWHGAYLADLRITAMGGDMRIDGVSLDFSLPSGVGSDAKDEANDASGIQPTGDVFIEGDDDNPVSVVLENVVLLPRDLASKLRSDGEVAAGENAFDTVVVEMQVTTDGEAVEDVKSSFPIDVCEDCLVKEPAEEDCEHGIQETGACRPGQEDVVYECAPAPSGGFLP